MANEGFEFGPNSPATRADIDRLVSAVEKGWVGRGFAIGFGTSLFSLIAGVLLGFLWLMVFSGSL